MTRPMSDLQRGAMADRIRAASAKLTADMRKAVGWPTYPDEHKSKVCPRCGGNGYLLIGIVGDESTQRYETCEECGGNGVIDQDDEA